MFQYMHSECSIDCLIISSTICLISSGRIRNTYRVKYFIQNYSRKHCITKNAPINFSIQHSINFFVDVEKYFLAKKNCIVGDVYYLMKVYDHCWILYLIFTAQKYVALLSYFGTCSTYCQHFSETNQLCRERPRFSFPQIAFLF